MTELTRAVTGINPQRDTMGLTAPKAAKLEKNLANKGT